MAANASQRRRQRVLACGACRSRRTRCDGNKPSCSACESRGIPCQYPELPERESPDLGAQLEQLRGQLDRIEHAVTSIPFSQRETPSIRDDAANPWELPPVQRVVSATSPEMAARDFPFMQVKNAAFARMTGLGGDFGNSLLRLERVHPLTVAPTPGLSVLQHDKITSSLQSFSESIHPWYPILGSDFADCVSRSLATSFHRSTESFLVLMVLASGAIAQADTYLEALETRPDVAYLHAALEMMHLVILEPTLRSIQCLAAASMHYYMLMKPIQAHDLAVIAIKKAQDLHISDGFHDNENELEHSIRIYRTILLIEGELVVPLRLSDTHAWETEEEIALPTGTDTWSFESIARNYVPDTPSTTNSTQPSDVVIYLLAEIAMRRMLRRNTTSITFSEHGTVEYAPLIARELEAQLEQWYSYLPEALRFPRNFQDVHSLSGLSPQVVFLCTQYWACKVSIFWPSVVKVIRSQVVPPETVNECHNFFYSFRQFVKSAIPALDKCLPNKWTLFASIFAISIGAFMGASEPLLAHIATEETWAVLRLARDCFGEECRYSPSLLVMRESIHGTLSLSLRQHDMEGQELSPRQ